MEVEFPFPPGCSHTSLGLWFPIWLSQGSAMLFAGRGICPAAANWSNKQVGWCTDNLLQVIAAVVGRCSSEWTDHSLLVTHAPSDYTLFLDTTVSKDSLRDNTWLCACMTTHKNWPIRLIPQWLLLRKFQKSPGVWSVRLFLDMEQRCVKLCGQLSLGAMCQEEQHSGPGHAAVQQMVQGLVLWVRTCTNRPGTREMGVSGTISTWNTICLSKAVYLQTSDCF